MALAYGAPDPQRPRRALATWITSCMSGRSTAGSSSARTAAGQLAVGTTWTDISTRPGRLGHPEIITNPARGSHEAYAVTSTGVFYMADSIPSATNPTPTWVNITGTLAASIHNQSYTIFGQPYDPLTDTNANFVYNQALNLTAIVADWRYTIPDNPANPNGPVHPILYVSADSGVYRSLDKGQTWTLFPNTSLDGSPVNGGYLPHANVSDLGLALGNVDVQTGMPNTAGPYDPTNPTPTGTPGDPDLLLASTYGRGSFGIRLAPLTLNTAIDPSNTNGVDPNGYTIVNTATPTFDGLSAITAFGNATWITIKDVTDPSHPRIIGGFDPATFNPSDPKWQALFKSGALGTNAQGNFAITTYSGTAGFTTNGLKTVEIYATDDAGAVGNLVTITFDLKATNLPPVPPTTPPTAPTLAISPGDITGPNKTVVPPYTNHPQPTFIGTTSPNAQVELLLVINAGAAPRIKSSVLLSS